MREFFDRYGVTALVVGAMAMVIALLPGNAPKTQDLTTGTGPEFAGGANGVVDGQGAGTVDGLTPATLADGSAAPTTGSGGVGSAGSGVTTGPGGTSGTGTATRAAAGATCRPDGREKGISRYMPPCIDLFRGNNGGATARGVHKDKIVVVRYMQQTDPATRAILQSYRLADDPAVVARAHDTLRRYGNLHYETYGREVQFVDLTASGSPEDDAAQKADAIKVADDIKAFAVIEGNPQEPIPKIFAQEAAARGVICMCTVSLSSQFYKENPPYIFGSLPTSTEYAINIGEYVGKRLAGRNAVWAGDSSYPIQNFKAKKRAFGLIYLEGRHGKVDPEGKRAADAVTAELAKYGVSLSAKVGYLYDPGRNQQDITTIIASMKQAGVTTVIGLFDPLSPILITTEASRQQYYPEWFITGTGLYDTTTAARLYDQTQWNHAFGISPLWVTWSDLKQSTGYREFHHARPGSSPGDEGALIAIYRAPVQTLFSGIHMAGPKLTADTFAAGAFKYPPTGGIPTAPLVFKTRDFPTEIKDFTEVFYGSQVQGKDERNSEGTGMILKVDGGRRYRPGQWPRTDPKVFDNNGAVATTGDVKLLDPDHEQDGHTHPATQRCLSCS